MSGFFAATMRRICSSTEVSKRFPFRHQIQLYVRGARCRHEIIFLPRACAALVRHERKLHRAHSIGFDSRALREFQKILCLSGDKPCLYN